MYSIDSELAEYYRFVPTFEQRQYSLNDQLYILSKFANKLGLYDAKDYLDKLKKVC